MLSLANSFNTLAPQRSELPSRTKNGSSSGIVQVSFMYEGLKTTTSLDKWKPITTTRTQSVTPKYFTSVKRNGVRITPV